MNDLFNSAPNETHYPYLFVHIIPKLEAFITRVRQGSIWSKTENKMDGWVYEWFDKGTMYKGMVANCEYTAEELGLWK